MASMPEKAAKAYKDRQAGMKLKDIAEKYGVSESAVKSWNSRYWVSLEKEKKKNGRKSQRKKVATKSDKVATQTSKRSQPRKSGYYGNKNAIGAHPSMNGNQYAVKHGAFSRIAIDLLSDEEKEIFQDCDIDVLSEHRQNYAILRVREHRLLEWRKKLIEMQAESKTGFMPTSMETSQSTDAKDQTTKSVKARQTLISDELDKADKGLNMIQSQQRAILNQIARLEEAERENEQNRPQTTDDGFIEALGEIADTLFENGDDSNLIPYEELS